MNTKKLPKVARKRNESKGPINKSTKNAPISLKKPKITFLQTNQNESQFSLEIRDRSKSNSKQKTETTGTSLLDIILNRKKSSNSFTNDIDSLQQERVIKRKKNCGGSGKKFNLGSSKNVLHCSIRTNSINTPKSLGVRKPVFGKPIILQRVKSPNVTPKALKNKEKIISLKQRKLSIFLHSPKKKSATDVKYSATPKNGIMTQGNNNMIKELGLRRSETNEFKLFPVKYKESILEISKSDVFEKSLLEDISSVEEFSDIEECGTPLLDYCNKIDTKRRLERNGVLTKFAFPNLKNTSKNGKLGENRKEFRIRRRTKKRHCFFPDLEILKNMKL